MASAIAPGATCRIGKGKTVWEIIDIRGDRLELSALGRSGYVNRTIQTDEVNSVAPQELDVTLGAVLSERARARSAAHDLWDRLRFSDPETIHDRAVKAESAAWSYAEACKLHAKGLAAIGIQEGEYP